tara:strand:- start:52 stop:273 length:222 start_codon:yes stop_codon:yes gene_type:complete
LEGKKQCEKYEDAKKGKQVNENSLNQVIDDAIFFEYLQVKEDFCDCKTYQNNVTCCQNHTLFFISVDRIANSV